MSSRGSRGGYPLAALGSEDWCGCPFYLFIYERFAIVRRPSLPEMPVKKDERCVLEYMNLLSGERDF